MDAHKVMGDNITYQDLERMATANGKGVEETLEIITRSADADRGRHPDEYAASDTQPAAAS